MRMLCGLAVAILGSSLSAATPELRGTWVTTTGLTNSTSTIFSAATTTTNFARLRNIGLNSVYVDAWRNGNTYFPSQTLRAITGTQLAPDAGGRDIFNETLIQSHRNGMAQFAWMQYGFAAQFLGSSGSPFNSLGIYMRDRGWLLKDSAGAYVNSTNSFAWMNPLVPEVRSLLINMGVELVKNYDLDGIQFDDRLAWPVQFGYDDYTRARYLAETGNALPTSATNSAFVAWRAQKITDFAKEFSAAIRAANPKVIVAATPGLYPSVYNNYCANSPNWLTQTVTVNGTTYPLFDEVVPQVYNSTVTGFNNSWNAQLTNFGTTNRDRTGAGISINNSAGAPYDWTTINLPQVNSQRNATGTRGHIWWYSSGVLDSDEANLTAYYNVAANGQAPRPDQVSSWRSAPRVATTPGSGIWNVTTLEKNRYQIIVRAGSTWSIWLNTVLPAGALTFNIGGPYSAAELIIDRRGYVDGDANFDGSVTFDDLLIVAQNYGQSGKIWNTGDFSFDGSVSFDDLLIVAQNYTGPALLGSDQLPETFLSDFALARALVPEPSLLLTLPLIFARRSRND